MFFSLASRRGLAMRVRTSRRSTVSNGMYEAECQGPTVSNSTVCIEPNAKLVVRMWSLFESCGH